MTDAVKPLECNVQSCGIGFQVTDLFKDTTFQPGTTGFLSYIMGSDHNHPNIAFQQVVTTRRGKTGKARINSNMILSPIFKLPDVDSEVLFPKTDERKEHFVDIVCEPDITAKLIGPDAPIDEPFLSWVFSRCLLVRELDKANYPGDHKIMSSVGLGGGGKQVYVWPKDKANVIRKFADQIERWHNEGRTDSIIEEFSNPEAKQRLLHQLRTIESALIIPRMEYQRKVSGMLLDALDHLSKFVNNKDNKIKTKDDLNASIKLTKKNIKGQRDVAAKIINNRLETTAKNRKLLNL